MSEMEKIDLESIETSNFIEEFIKVFKMLIVAL